MEPGRTRRSFGWWASWIWGHPLRSATCWASSKARAPGEIVIDLRGVCFLDSMGLSALVEAHVAGQDGQREVSFIKGGRSVQRVFSVTEMDKRVTWTDPFRSAAQG